MREINKQDLIYSKNGNIDWMAMIGKKIHFVYDDVESYLVIDRMLNDKKAIISGEFNSEFEIKKLDIRDCNLHRFLKKSTRDYYYKVGDIINNLEIIECTRLKHNGYDEKAYVVKCMYDGYKFCTYECNLRKGVGCGVCNGKICIHGVNDVYTTRPDVRNCFKNIEDAKRYTEKSQKKVRYVCPTCGMEKSNVVPVYFISTNRVTCDYCDVKYSYPNRFMENLLDILNVKYIKEFSPSWANDNGSQRRYDFYIPSKNLIIEMDGGWHYEDNKLSGQTIGETTVIDKWKNEVAIENGINVIRIDCRVSEMDYIVNSILESDFPYVFNNEESHKAEILARGSVMKEVCGIYNLTKGELSNKDIGILMGVSRDTVLRLLKIGNGIGLCEYDPKVTQYSCRLIGSIIRRKKIEVFKNEESLGVFQSAKYIEENAMELFGVDIKSRAIPRVCDGARRVYKGFTFKYVD